MKTNLKLHEHPVGAGRAERRDDITYLTLTDASADVYSDAQLDDYTGRLRQHYPWRPPLRMTVRARYSRPAGESHQSESYRSCLPEARGDA